MTFAFLMLSGVTKTKFVATYSDLIVHGEVLKSLFCFATGYKLFKITASARKKELLVGLNLHFFRYTLFS